MKVLLKSWTDNLYELFTKEVGIYTDLHALEIAKAEAIILADGKKIESLAKKSYELMVTASEIERSRMGSISEIYEKAALEMSGTAPTLNEFLNQIDRDSNFRLKGITNSLRETVQKLKEKILSNEKLLQSRRDLFQKTLQSVKSSAEENVYHGENNRGKKSSGPLMVNTRA